MKPILLNPIRLISLLQFIFVFNFNGFTQDYCSKSKNIISILDKYHYKPKILDDSLSLFVFNKTIQNLDPDNVFITQADIDDLKKHSFLIDDQINVNDCKFLNDLSEIYNNKLNIVSQHLFDIENKTFSFTEDDEIVFDSPIRKNNNEDIKKRWEKWIKFLILSYGYSSSENKIYSKEEIKKNQKSALMLLRCLIESRIGSAEEYKKYVAKQFYKALTEYYDPHTLYLSTEENKEFEDGLSDNTISFGFELEVNKKGELAIETLTPGGAAWKSNELNNGDVIVEAKLFNKEKTSLLFDCIHLDQSLSTLSRVDIQKANFKIRKQSGEFTSVLLEKDTVRIEENVIQSFILNGEKKIGYMYLPSFYSELNTNNPYANGCANDIAKELITIKREGIEGLIFDLRDNGGGSMLEAIRLVGIFIDYGAIYIMDRKGEPPYTMKDLSRGTIFNKPLVVLVNSYSASASEVFAAAIQDQNRGLIVGSQTYGKSTSQIAYSLGEETNNKNELDVINITQGALYRVDGTTHQKTGVIPDIHIPIAYADKKSGERLYPTALSLEKIEKKTYYYPKPKIEIEKIKANSIFRTNQDTTFMKIKKAQQKAVLQTKEVTVPLNYSDFKNYIDKKYADINFLKEHSLYQTSNPDYLKGFSSTDDIEKEINHETIQNIQMDPYIYESYQILNDLIKTTN